VNAQWAAQPKQWSSSGGLESGQWLGQQGVWRGHQHSNQQFVGAPQQWWDDDNHPLGASAPGTHRTCFALATLGCSFLLGTERLAQS
jgi:hypothetical protein